MYSASAGGRVDRLGLGGNIIETGTDSLHPAQTRAKGRSVLTDKG